MKKKDTTTPIQRRTFLKRTALASMTVPFSPVESLFTDRPAEDRLEIHLFSKHLQFLDYEDMAAVAKDMGFDGLDLTVRPGGHVLPENVAADLPKAARAMEKYGVPPKLITTAIDNAEDPVNRKVLQTAADLGFQSYRSNWVRYPEEGPLPEALENFQPQMNRLADFNKELGLEGAYQNHSGPFVGASMWEVWKLIEEADPVGMGSQYDIRHAVVEGGLSWKTGLRLIHSRIKTIVLKDFLWEKQNNGQWHVQNVPIGEGMVDFIEYFKLLKQYGIKVPVSLHLEYDLGGAQSGRKDIRISKYEVFAAMQKDLQRAQELWQAAV